MDSVDDFERLARKLKKVMKDFAYPAVRFGRIVYKTNVVHTMKAKNFQLPGC